MEWKVAPSYNSFNIDRVDEVNRKALVTRKCGRCGGTGAFIIPGIFQGTCFQCNGTGVEQKWVKAYTPEEYNRYIQSVARAKERKEEKRFAEIRDKEEHSEDNRRIALTELGYDVDNPAVYLVVGENTYAIKDELKERGGHFSPALNWYFTHEVELPKGYSLVARDVSQFFNWNPQTKKFSIAENAKENADAARAELLPESKSEYIGSIKERLRDMRVTLTGCRGFQSMYGYTIIYTFAYGDNVLVWMTTSEQNIEVNHEYMLTGTVKKFEEYNGVKQTHLSRCIVKEVAQKTKTGPESQLEK